MAKSILLVDRADRAVYMSKTAGRNRVSVCEADLTRVPDIGHAIASVAPARAHVVEMHQ